MKLLYNNSNGYTDEARRLAQEARVFATRVIQENPEFSAVEILGMLTLGFTEAHVDVSMERRFTSKAK